MMLVPGLALFYGRMVRSKNILSVFTQCLAVGGAIGVLWVVYGYSLVIDATEILPIAPIRRVISAVDPDLCIFRPFCPEWCRCRGQTPAKPGRSENWHAPCFL